MTVIHSQASYGGWRRFSHWPRRASLLQKAWRPFAIGVDACRIAIDRRRLTSGPCAIAGSAAAKSSTSTATASKPSVALGLIRCTSRPFDPRATRLRRVR